MALPVSGAISLSNVNTELSLGATAQISLNDAAVRTLFGIASGAIDMNTGHGKSSFSGFTFAISANTTNANLRTLAVAAGWNQTSKVVATVNTGIYVYSTSTANAGLTINGAFPAGVELVNNGNIMGMGGAGGSGGAAPTVGGAGGHAISIALNVTITNNSYIAGGGGGGGGGGSDGFGGGYGGGGGGAGGAAGGAAGLAGGTGGAGGGVGAAGGTGVSVTPTEQSAAGGGGGGRILPGTGGVTVTGALAGRGGGGGAGGAGGGNFFGGDTNAGENGGNGGAAGVAGVGASYAGGGGGGWGAAGGATVARAGGAAGKAVLANGFTVTWLANGTRYGALT